MEVNELLEELVKKRLESALNANGENALDADRSAQEWMKLYVAAGKMSNDAIDKSNSALHETAKLDFEKSKFDKEFEMRIREADAHDRELDIRESDLDLRKVIADADKNIRMEELEAKNRELDQRTEAAKTDTRMRELELQFHQTELDFERVKHDADMSVTRANNYWQNGITTVSTVVEPLTKVVCVGASMAMLKYASELVIKQQTAMADYEQHGVFAMSPSKMVFNPVDLVKNVITKNIF